MKKFTFLIFALIIISCSKDEPTYCCTNIDVAISIDFENEAGENILEEENGIAASNIKLYHKIGEQWEEYFEGHLDAPRGVRMVDEGGEKFLIVYPNTETGNGDLSETRIMFSENDEDVLTTEIYSQGSTTAVTKVWYNGELMWETGETHRRFTVIK